MRSSSRAVLTGYSAEHARGEARRRAEPASMQAEPQRCAGFTRSGGGERAVEGHAGSSGAGMRWPAGVRGGFLHAFWGGIGRRDWRLVQKMLGEANGEQE